MTCAEVREELVAHDRGELSPAEAAAVRAHLEACPDCAEELVALRRVLGLVRSAGELEPSPAASARLLSAVDAELAARPARAPARVVSPSGFRARARETWDYARWRYQTSSNVRRVTFASIALHAAAVAFFAWLLVGEDGRARDAVVAIGEPRSAGSLHEEGLEDRDGGFPDVERVPDATADSRGGGLPEFLPESPFGVPPDRPAFPGNVPLSYPTRSLMLRLSIAMDDRAKESHLRSLLADEAPLVSESIDRGLDWLAARQHDDGSWGPAGAEQTEVRAGVTAAVVLAYTSDGRSALRGEDAPRIARAVGRLEDWLADGLSDDPARRGLYSRSLAVRALVQQYGVDYKTLAPAQRHARRTLLVNAGRELTAWQAPNGGFGYAPRSDRPDASCTLFAGAALADLHAAGVLDTREAVARASRYLSGLRAPDGRLDYLRPGDREGDLALTASLLAHAPELGMPRGPEAVVDAVARSVVGRDGPDALLDWSAMAALRRLDRPLRGPIRAVRGRQRKDGSWPALADRHCAQGGDELTTAFGVLALTRAYLP